MNNKHESDFDFSPEYGTKAVARGNNFEVGGVPFAEPFKPTNEVQNDEIKTEKVYFSADEDAQTVVKPISGGAVPIVAPSPIVQLQPIVVPIAVVPYTSRTENVLQVNQSGQAVQPKRAANANSNSHNTNSYNENANTYNANAPYANAVSDNPFDTATNANNGASKAEREGGSGRGKSLIAMLVSVLFLVPFIIAYVKFDLIASFNLMDLNIIGRLAFFIANSGVFSLAGQIPFLLLMVAAGLMFVQFLVSLIGLIIGKYLKILSLVLSVLSALLALGVVIYAFVPSLGYVATNVNSFFLPLALGLIAAVLSIVMALGKKEPKVNAEI